ncbi:iron chelate uptake ABC transporter family permease subunit [Fulvimarina sp. 2208YS6-2-32]|uniref:Iron chelate uptake ABC transporter family permease subunit n=1 Tax=Fulvimarina uroteuthidis TaxID=3098149 RepID=A0ABU5I249_9HYPH|nr:iron chelate uptake ABC transporter family permease subunit [Fulvimarina sp. 2208YS6-2-32]MDY8108894.1 iron chelate uptake ABC transporter family permease subunit [Fulvimarina sp. 2208YS6-2-32]
MTFISADPGAVALQRRRASRRTSLTIALLAGLTAALFVITLVVGQTVTPIDEVLAVLLGDEVPGTGFLVGTLRLPRAVLSLLVGTSFGLGGVTFQIMLRNPLASPDIIGISSGASVAAVFAIVVLALNGPIVSVFAVTAGLAIALLIYALSFRDGVVGSRLILIGIGVASMLQSATAYILSIAPAWSLQESIRWITGSVNGARLEQALPVAAALLVFGTILIRLSRDLALLRLGEDAASALGVRVELTRILAIVAAVGLIAFATAATGPIAFVAFLSGPIAARIVGPGSVLVPAALVGAILVLAGDYAGQQLLPSRYPVGVVTGALGAPYLIYLLIRSNRGKGMA